MNKKISFNSKNFTIAFHYYLNNILQIMHILILNKVDYTDNKSVTKLSNTVLLHCITFLFILLNYNTKWP